MDALALYIMIDIPKSIDYETFAFIPIGTFTIVIFLWLYQ